MCPNKDIPASDKGLMDFELYTKVIDEAKNFVSDIYLHHRGEPFLNPHIYEMIIYARERGIKVRLHTNATVLSKEKAEKVLEAQPDLISISFDGFQKDIYEDIRKGADFEKTVANIVGLLELRQNRKQVKPYIVIEKIDFPKYEDKVNRQEVDKLTKCFKEKGLDELIVKKEYEWVTESAPEMLDKTAYSQCTFPWYAMVICSDGTVTPCPQDYMAGIPLGNVKVKTLPEIWNDSPYVKLRENLLHNIKELKLCTKCDRLCRPQVAGLPFQYLYTFLADHFLGYGKLRKLIGSFERN